MGYPSLQNFVKMNFTEEQSDVDQVFEMAASCVLTIADESQVYDCKDVQRQNWLNGSVN